MGREGEVRVLMNTLNSSFLCLCFFLSDTHIHRHNDADENKTCPKTKLLGQVKNKNKLELSVFIRTRTSPSLQISLFMLYL